MEFEQILKLKLKQMNKTDDEILEKLDLQPSLELDALNLGLAALGLIVSTLIRLIEALE